ncbi:hypothetical protein DFP72DRAFT_916507 [Ephemerocybe angulata]|uniref:Uncharacterized protein n=1 Tax=Ephemerocybe angulata TaxID=980116 RepID=A0A8H6HJT5_9AGAR|nr:hypothetical protein DFP72DRAFT_916507 [Tulosesus angulatus]
MFVFFAVSTAFHVLPSFFLAFLRFLHLLFLGNCIAFVTLLIALSLPFIVPSHMYSLSHLLLHSYRPLSFVFWPRKVACSSLVVCRTTA